MYETMKEKEEQEKLLKEKKRKKASLINTLILLLIIAGLVGFIYVKRDALFSNKTNEETKTETKEETKKEENKEEPKEENEKEYSIVREGKLSSDESLASTNIKVNDKELKLEYRFIDEDEGPGKITLKVNNTDIYNEQALDGIGYISYQVFKATDNKEYLIVKYNQWGFYSTILDSNAKILKTISPYDKETECFISLDNENEINQEELVDNLTTIKNGEVYYYKYKSESLDDNSNIKLSEVKITIKDGIITETNTGNEKTGSVGQCS